MTTSASADRDANRDANEAAAAAPPGTPRVGLLLPSTNSVMEPDLWGALWPQASVHTSRLPLDDVTAEAERRMLATAPAAATGLAPLRTRLTVFGCTSAGGILGRDAERALVADLAGRSGSAVVSVLDAAVEALREIGPRSIALFTPYVRELSQAVAASLASEGFPVSHVASLELTDNAAIGHLTPEEIHEAVIQDVTHVPVDAVFVSCTNLRAMEAAAGISRSLGKPVITSNGAVARAAARRLGLTAGRTPT